MREHWSQSQRENMAFKPQHPVQATPCATQIHVLLKKKSPYQGTSPPRFWLVSFPGNILKKKIMGIKFRPPDAAILKKLTDNYHSPPPPTHT